MQLKEPYDDELVRVFAGLFGRPSFKVSVDRQKRVIDEVTVMRDACCGCARFSADKLSGTAIADALLDIGLHHHHFPCQASMGIDPLFGDTLMHVSGNIMKDALKEALGPDLAIQFIKPSGYAESPDADES